MAYFSLINTPYTDRVMRKPARRGVGEAAAVSHRQYGLLTKWRISL
jgi:hypothetical protein